MKVRDKKYKCCNHCNVEGFPYPFFYPNECLIFIGKITKVGAGIGAYADEFGKLSNEWLNGNIGTGGYTEDSCNPFCILCKEPSILEEEMLEVIDLPERWTITRLIVHGKEEWVFHHRCNPSSATPLLGRLKKNTHRIYGKIYRCSRCKTHAPKQVIIQLNLKKVGDIR